MKKDMIHCYLFTLSYRVMLVRLLYDKKHKYISCNYSHLQICLSHSIVNEHIFKFFMGRPTTSLCGRTPSISVHHVR